MTDRVSQPSARPTNKVLAFAISAAFVAVAGRVLAEYAPMLNIPEVLDLIAIAAGAVVSWFIKDRPNVETST